MLRGRLQQLLEEKQHLESSESTGELESAEALQEELKRVWSACPRRASAEKFVANSRAGLGRRPMIKLSWQGRKRPC